MALETLTFYSTLLGVSPALLVIALIWSAVWKGLALWRAAHKESKVWFVVLLVVNTLGILEILYLFIFSEMGAKKPSKRKKKRR